ncbi:DDE-type integrase/transposase/recombinase [Streptomyces europaeiscabiei]|uniref:DDE-type integrase/transposase/recombinase n=1 Tax=Streptomyces europaeiscabiei TaxID=146819 RepID=UPI00399BB051
MTEIETGEGKIYLATVIDAFSRRCLGYAMGEHHDAALAGASLKMAAVTRGGSLDGTIFHSDRGAELGLNRSSQHRLSGPILGALRGPRRVSSIRGFCGACC